MCQVLDVVWGRPADGKQDITGFQGQHPAAARELLAQELPETPRWYRLDLQKAGGVKKR